MSELPMNSSLAAFEHLVLSEAEALAIWSRAAQLPDEAEPAVGGPTGLGDAPAPPWALSFDALIGGPPTQGGVLRFTVPVMGRCPVDASVPQPLNGFIYHASRVGLLELHVTVTPLGTDPQPACAVTITGDLRAGEQRSIGIYRALATGLAGVVAVTGAILGSKAWGASGAVAGLGLGAALAFGFNRVVAAIGRAEHRLAHRVLTAELDDVLRALQRPSDEARAFGAAAPARSPQLVRTPDAAQHRLPALQPSFNFALG